MSRKNGREAKAARRAEREAKANRRMDRSLDGLQAQLTALYDSATSARQHVRENAAEMAEVRDRLRDLLTPLAATGLPTAEALATLPPEQRAEVIELAQRMADLGGPVLFAGPGRPE